LCCLGLVIWVIYLIFSSFDKDKPKRGKNSQKRRPSTEPILPVSQKKDAEPGQFPPPKGRGAVHYHYHATFPSGSPQGIRRRSVGGTDYLVQEIGPDGELPQQQPWGFPPMPWGQWGMPGMGPVPPMGWWGAPAQSESKEVPEDTPEKAKSEEKVPVKSTPPSYVPKKPPVPAEVESGKRYLKAGSNEAEEFFSYALGPKKTQRVRKPGPPPDIMNPDKDNSALLHHMKRKQLEIENGWDGIADPDCDSEPSTPASVRRCRYDNLSYAQFKEIQELNDLIRQCPDGSEEKMIQEIQALHNEYIAVSNDIKNLEEHQRGSMALPPGIAAQSPVATSRMGSVRLGITPRGSHAPEAAISGSIVSPRAAMNVESPRDAQISPSPRLNDTSPKLIATSDDTSSKIESPAEEIEVGVFNQDEKAAMLSLESVIRVDDASPLRSPVAIVASPRSEIRTESPIASPVAEIYRTRTPSELLHDYVSGVETPRAASPRSIRSATSPVALVEGSRHNSREASPASYRSASLVKSEVGSPYPLRNEVSVESLRKGVHNTDTTRDSVRSSPSTLKAEEQPTYINEEGA
jgi:hypothetical protein